MILKRLLALGLVFLAGYLAIDAIVANRDMILAERVLQVAACLTVVYVYWPDAIEALGAKHEPQHGDYLIIGIVLGQVASIFQALFAIVYRMAGSPEWLANSDINGIWIMLAVLASGLHVLAPGAISGTVPRRSRVAAGAALGAAAIVALFLLVARPNIAPAIEKLRPYLSDWFGTDG